MTRAIIYVVFVSVIIVELAQYSPVKRRHTSLKSGRVKEKKRKKNWNVPAPAHADRIQLFNFIIGLAHYNTTVSFAYVVIHLETLQRWCDVSTLTLIQLKKILGQLAIQVHTEGHTYQSSISDDE